MKPRILVVGAGHLGRFHAAKIAANPEAVLAGVVDVDLPRAQALAHAHQSTAHTSMQAFADQVDGAIVATPTVTHLAVSREALAMGWHILVEKPLAHDVSSAQQIVALAKACGRVLQVGHTERFNPAIAAALRIADRPHYITAERLAPFSGRGIDVDVVFDLMIHDLDIVASLVQAPCREVRAVGVPVLTQAVDMASARLAFADGTVAQLSAGRASLEASRKIRLFTEQRYVSIDCAKREVKSVRRMPAADPTAWPEILAEPIDVPADDALAVQDQEFAASIAQGYAPRVDGAAGLRALELAEAVKAAMMTPWVAPNIAGEAASQQTGQTAGPLAS